uniref:Myosin motor domain-containing protein n=1 Tax=Glossina brevipalpis TaxID=37001 RepID=A0A1A9WFZ4_9MUSC
MATLGLSKVFILDKYFTELQKFWETEKKLQDASSSNEAVHLQQRLKSLSTELVTLRNRLHVGQGQNAIATATTATTNGSTNITFQQQSQPQQGPLEAGLELNASSSTNPNSTTNNNHHHNSSNNSSNNLHNNNLNNFNGNGNNPAQSQKAHSGLIFSTINNHNNNSSNNNKNNSISNTSNCSNNVNLTSPPIATTITVTTVTNTVVHHQTSPSIINNKNSHIFSHTLPHNTSIVSSGIASSRNTSIPHPLPHQINEKGIVSSSAHNFVDSVVMPALPAPAVNVFSNSVHTLPIRSTAQTHIQNQPLPFIPLQKHLNPCHGISSLSTGYPNASLNATQIALHNSNNNHNSSGGPMSPYANQIKSISYGQQQQQQRHLVKRPHELEDLIHLSGPLTEDATNVGPILLSINPYLDVGNPLTLSSTRSLPLALQLRKIVQEAVRQQAETGYPQAIILSGTSGAGKTHCSMLLLRQLFAVAGGGPETDAFKHLAAAFTVLRSLGSAKTTSNSESSRIGQFIEVQVTDGALYRTKIHCYFLDQTRVIRPLHKEKNYHIFYQMLAGLNREERIKLNLEGYAPSNLRYLQYGDVNQNEQDDALRFQAWKTCLGILGIPFLDVVRVLAAVLLLGNVQFVDGQSLEVNVKGESELNAVASLLGVPPAALCRGLTTRTHNARGQLIKSVCDANMSNMTRDCLAKALYCRTVATIVRRANSLKRLGSTLGTLSSDSNESVHNQADINSQHASTIGGNSGSKSMAALNNAVRHATDGFIGILDMFGFEQPTPHAQLEHLCINLCAETMQHFYNTHIFKSSVESCRDEGIICDTEVDYGQGHMDNVPCIDLISSLRTGLLSMLDAECSVRGTAESYVVKIKVQHRNSPRLESKHTGEPHDPRMFTIRHFAGRVEYDATDFLDTNRDVVPDDLVAVFYKHTCNFGFATHLFGSELKALFALQSVPRGLSFRIAPTSHSDLLNGDEPVSTLTQDFHTRLDNLLRTLVHARPHFIRCIRSNSSEGAGCFERMCVVKQIRSLQVLETVNLMASGFPHRMRFKQFNARYRMLAPFCLVRRSEDKMEECCNMILEYAMENPPFVEGSVTLAWAPGKRHVFLSEGIRQHLEHLRTEIRNKSATLIQASWRGWQWRKKLGAVKHQRSRVGNNGLLVLPAAIKLTKNHGTATSNGLVTQPATSASGPRLSTKTTNLNTVTRPRPQPIAGTPPPDPNEKCDAKIIQQTCSLFGLDLERPPPVPPSRNYTIVGNTKLNFPQNRIMKMTFPEDTLSNLPPEQLKKGETVTVVGASSCRGHLIVENKGQNYHVPYQFMELIRGQNITSNNAGNINKSTSNSNLPNNSNSNNNNTNVNNGGNATTNGAVKI